MKHVAQAGLEHTSHVITTESSSLSSLTAPLFGWLPEYQLPKLWSVDEGCEESSCNTLLRDVLRISLSHWCTISIRVLSSLGS